MRARRGFTLLEVLVAVAILGLGLTVILTSQTSSFSGAQTAQHLSVAGNLARCKMSELELELLTKGFQVTDQHGEGDCCEGEEDRTYSCTWKVERVELPQPKGLDAMGDGGIGESSGLGAFGSMAGLQAGGPGMLSGDGGIGGLASLLSSGAAAGGTQGMAPLVMSMVYPDLKPMLEESIRKVTVSVLWKQGKREDHLDVIQFVTNPQQGGLDPNAAKGLEAIGDALGGLTGSGSGTGGGASKGTSTGTRTGGPRR